MPGVRRKLGRLTVSLTAITGLCLTIALAGSASATSTDTWRSYNLTQESGGQAATGTPSLLTDPQGANQQAVTDSPSSDVIQFGGDGSSGSTAATNVTTISEGGGGPASTASPSAVADPQSDDFLIFTDTSNGDLEEYDRSDFVWHPDNITSSAGGQTIVGTPSAVVGSGGVLTVAADSSNGHLIVFTRATSGGAWTATDTNPPTDLNITDDPWAAIDPAGGGLDVFAKGTDGALLEIDNDGGGWAGEDISSDNGGQMIDSDPVSVVSGGLIDVFATASGGDLIEWSRSASGTWTSQNLTALSGGPAVSGTPTAVVDPQGGIDVFTASSDEHLIEYSGSGSSWSGTDLTTADAGPTAGDDPAADISPDTGDVTVDVVNGSGDLIEFQRTVVPAPAGTATTTPPTATTAPVTGVPTQTVESTPPPTKVRDRVKVQVLTDWTWNRTASELHSITMGKLKPGEGLTLACVGTGRHTTRGCPYRKRSARGPAAVRKLIHGLARTGYRVGDVLTITVSEPGLRPLVARLRIRADKAPGMVG